MVVRRCHCSGAVRGAGNRRVATERGSVPVRAGAVDSRADRRASLTWFHGQLNRRLGWPRRPANLWKKPLRRLPRTQDLFHAHFGPAGYRVVDAGLSPTVTSFYGYDASERRTLARWGRAYRHLFRKGAAFVAEGPAMRERLIGLGAPPSRNARHPADRSPGRRLAAGLPLRGRGSSRADDRSSRREEGICRGGRGLRRGEAIPR